MFADDPRRADRLAAIRSAEHGVYQTIALALIGAIAFLAMVFVLAKPAHAEGCQYTNSGRMICGGEITTAQRVSHRHRRARAHEKPTLDPHGNAAAPVVTDVTIASEIDEEAAAWRKPIAVAKGYIRSRKTGATTSIEARYQAQFQALADDLEDYSPESKIYYMGGFRPGHCSKRHQHSCKLAVDFCQDSRGRISGARDCHLPPPAEFHRLVRKHHLFDGSVWCDGDYGHVQALYSGGCSATAHGIAAGILYTITGKVMQVARAAPRHRRHYAQRDYSARQHVAHYHRHHRQRLARQL